jgi:hypothetical protein
MAHVHGQSFKSDDLIAYFCAEFGFHESLPIYSGGLGILAGDHCKAPATWACPSSASACSTARATSSRRSTPTATARDLHRFGFRRPADFPAARRQRPGSAGRRRVSRPHRTRQGLGSPVGHVRLILLDTWLPQNTSTTARSPTASTAATGRRASSRKSCSASAAFAPSPHPRPQADGLARQRRPRRLPHPRTHPQPGHRRPALCRGHRGGRLQCRVHDPHAGAGRP